MDVLGPRLDLGSYWVSVSRLEFPYTLGFGVKMLVSYCTLLVMRFVLFVGLCCGLVVDPMSSWVLLLCYEKFMEKLYIWVF